MSGGATGTSSPWCGSSSPPIGSTTPSRACRPTLRDADVLARWDREELLVLLPETDQTGADAAAERLRDSVRDVPMLAGAVQWSGGSAEGLLSRARWVAARPV